MANFMQRCRFLPDDPKLMTAAQKAWFSQDAAFKFKYVIRPNGFTSIAVQENQVRVFFNGILKTLNYLIYT